ncbi:hypothetical protein ACJQWK_08106 [Exserohilum turcicum]
MSTSAGQKVTTDPASKVPINEAVGTVISDSLAGESLKSSGAFGEGNPKAGVSGQPSASTTTNTSDTSSATKLNAAVNAEARDAQQGWDEEKIMNSGKGLGSTSNGSGGASSVTGTAPTAVPGTNIDPSVLQPKGANLTEDPNMDGQRKFGEIGTENDPGRLAERKLQGINAANPGVEPKTTDMAQGGETKFSKLGETTA